MNFRKWVTIGLIIYVPLMVKVPNIPAFPIINVFFIFMLGILCQYQE